MIATIKQVSKILSGYEVVVELDTGRSKLFSFAEDVTAAKIKLVIRTWLQEKKNQEGRLPQLRTALVGDVIEV